MRGAHMGRAVRHLCLHYSSLCAACYGADQCFKWTYTTSGWGPGCKLITGDLFETLKGLKILELDGEFEVLLPALPSLPALGLLRLAGASGHSRRRRLQDGVLLATLERQHALLRLEVSNVDLYNQNSPIRANDSNRSDEVDRLNSETKLPIVTVTTLLLNGMDVNSLVLEHILHHLTHLNSVAIEWYSTIDKIFDVRDYYEDDDLDGEDTGDDDGLIMHKRYPSTYLASAIEQASLTLERPTLVQNFKSTHTFEDVSTIHSLCAFEYLRELVISPELLIGRHVCPRRPLVTKTLACQSLADMLPSRLVSLTLTTNFDQAERRGAEYRTDIVKGLLLQLWRLRCLKRIIFLELRQLQPNVGYSIRRDCRCYDVSVQARCYSDGPRSRRREEMTKEEEVLFECAIIACKMAGISLILAKNKEIGSKECFEVYQKRWRLDGM